MRELTVNESRKFIDGVSRVHIGSFSFVAGRGRKEQILKHGACWHIDHFRITWHLYTNSPRVTSGNSVIRARWYIQPMWRSIKPTIIQMYHPPSLLLLHTILYRHLTRNTISYGSSIHITYREVEFCFYAVSMYTTRVVGSLLCWCRSWVEIWPPANEVSHCNIPGVWQLQNTVHVLRSCYNSFNLASLQLYIAGSRKSKWKYLFPDTIWLHVAFFSSSISSHRFCQPPQSHHCCNTDHETILNHGRVVWREKFYLTCLLAC